MAFGDIKKPGDLIKAEDWNTAMQEIVKKVNRAGDAIAGSLTINGNLGIGTTYINYPLSLGSNLADTKLALYDVGPNGNAHGLGIQSNQFRLHLSGETDRFSFLNSAKGDEIFTIQGTGSVGIGTTGPFFIGPTGPFYGKLQVEEVNDNAVAIAMGNPSRKLFIVPKLTEGAYNPLSRPGDLGIFWQAEKEEDGNLVIGHWSRKADTVAGLRITAEGKVGIGSVYPQCPLHIKKDWSFLGLDTNKEGKEGQDCGIRLYQNGKVKWHIFNDALKYDDPAKDTDKTWNIFHIEPEGGSGLVIEQSGNVGIGTSEPKVRLHVPNGAILNDVAIGVNPPGGKTASFKLTKQSFDGLNQDIPDELLKSLKLIENQPSLDESAFLNAVEQRIGKVQTVKYKELILKYAEDEIKFAYFNETIGTTTKIANLRLHSYNGIYFHPGNSHLERGGFGPDGNWIGSTRELKTNIHDFAIHEAIEILTNLNPVKFAYKADEKKKLHVGFIAEDVPAMIANENRRMISEMDIIATLTMVVKDMIKKLGM